MKNCINTRFASFFVAFLSLFFITASAQPVKTGGKLVDNGALWIPDYVTELPGMKMGPFVRRSDGGILTTENNKCAISLDEGKTWKEYAIFKDTSKFKISNERTMIRTSSGTIILAFMNLQEKAKWKWEKDISDTRGAILPTYVVKSRDGGKTWEMPQKLHNEWTGAIRDIIETRNGNIVFTSMMFRHNPGHHTVLTYTSRNDGDNWERSNIIDLGGIGNHSGVTESTLEELKDGRLWMLMRTNWGTFWETFSDDDGITWKDIKPTGISASSSPGMLKRLGSGRLLLVWNLQFPEAKNYYPMRGGDMQWSEVAASNYREELVVAFSEDDGKTWSKPKIVGKMIKNAGIDIPVAWISYPYVFEVAPGEIWITTMQSKLRIKLFEKDFIK